MLAVTVARPRLVRGVVWLSYGMTCAAPTHSSILRTCWRFFSTMLVLAMRLPMLLVLFALDAIRASWNCIVLPWVLLILPSPSRALD